MKTSGSKREFSTGSVRHCAKGKGRYDLVSPIALRRLALHYESGGEVFGDRDWEKGQPMSTLLDSAKRHLENYHLGMRDEDHLAAAAWNVFAMMHVEDQASQGRLPRELLDLPDYLTKIF